MSKQMTTKDTTIPLGSLIFVIDAGETYSTYEVMAQHMHLTNYVDGVSPFRNGEYAKVVGKGKHHRMGNELLGIELQNGAQGLISIEGVELVQKAEVSSSVVTPTYEELTVELVTLKAKLWDAEQKLKKIAELAA